MMYLALLPLLAVVTLTTSNVLYFKPHDLGGVKCPDGESECPTGNTCCKQRSGRYGCCPLPHANCCSDGVHCCPAKAKCDLVHKTCISQGVNVPLLQKFPAKLKVKNMLRLKDSVYEAEMSDYPSNSVKHIHWNKLMKSWKKHPSHVMCPDKDSECKDGQTCCLNLQGKYDCCPLPDAVCCTDGVHCCPLGSTCNLEKGRCDEVKLKIMVVKKEKNVPCPDSRYSCKDGQTCCKTKTGYGCCPIKHAVCCSDEKHCCPEDYTCNTVNGTCQKGRSVVEWFTKLEPVNKESITCPGGEQTCTSSQTCCEAGTGYGCCPIPNAVCCSDEKHCCPKDYTCNTGSGTCQNGRSIVEWFTKLEPVNKERITCPGGEQTCTSSQTCCKAGTGYGCCPIPNAVCCSDEKHCCPKDYTCNTGSGTCQNGRSIVEWFTKLEPVNKERITCPGGEQTCTSSQTCCKAGTGYGCCPIPNAVCCSDEKHCCPKDYTCNTGSGTCQNGRSIVEWFTKLEPVNKERITCPGGEQTCTSSQTCCKAGTGYGCCPIPNAVCCSDEKHCCPKDYTCNTGSGTCQNGRSIVEWFTKLEPVNKERITCPGGEQTCTSSQTCCKAGTGYGCCPIPNAVCCSDTKHCCPSGYRCDATGGRCISGNQVIDWLSKKEVVKPEPQITNTCCGNSTCCPFEGAECCTNANYCCPEDYICDEQPFCCRERDGESKKRGVYYNMMLKKMAKKMGVKLIDFE